MAEPWNGSYVLLELDVGPKATGPMSMASFFLNSSFPRSNPGVLEVDKSTSSHTD